MNEEKLDELLTIDEELTTKRIKRKINKTIYSKIIYTLCFCLFITGSILWFKKYREDQAQREFEAYEESLNYFNPYDYNERKNVPSYTFGLLMETSIEMLYPGIACYDADYSVNNPSKYTYSYRAIIEKYEKYPEVATGGSNLEITISRSQFTEKNDMDGLLILYRNLFKSPNDTSTYETFNMVSDSLIQDIKELPESSVIDVAISFNQEKGSSEIIQLINQYPQSLFTWLATDSIDRDWSNHYGITDGFNLIQQFASDYELSLNKKYPYFTFSNDELSADVIDHSYISRCQFLLDHEDFLNIEGNFFNKMQIEHKYNQAKTMIEEHGEMQFIGIYGTLKKADLLDLIQQENIQFAHVVDVKLSVLQK